VLSGRRWDKACPIEDDRDVDILGDAVRVLFCKCPGDEGSNYADEEKECESLVSLAMRELKLRSDDTPDSVSGEKYAGAGAKEAILLVRRAHLLNIAKHPSLDGKLHGTSDNSCYDLAPEHRPRGIFL